MKHVMTREDALSDIQCGRGIMLTFHGRFTSYRVIMRRKAALLERGVDQTEAVFEDLRYHRIYRFNVSEEQVTSYIERWYPRVTDEVIDTTTLWKEVA